MRRYETRESAKMEMCSDVGKKKKKREEKYKKRKRKREKTSTEKCEISSLVASRKMPLFLIFINLM